MFLIGDQIYITHTHTHTRARARAHTHTHTHTQHTHNTRMHPHSWVPLCKYCLSCRRASASDCPDGGAVPSERRHQRLRLCHRKPETINLSALRPTVVLTPFPCSCSRSFIFASSQWSLQTCVKSLCGALIVPVKTDLTGTDLPESPLCRARG